MFLFKLKTGQILNLDQVTRINPQIDPVSKKNYLDMELGGLNVTIKDEQDLKAFREVVDRFCCNTPERI